MPPQTRNRTDSRFLLHRLEKRHVASYARRKKCFRLLADPIRVARRGTVLPALLSFAPGPARSNVLSGRKLFTAESREIHDR